MSNVLKILSKSDPGEPPLPPSDWGSLTNASFNGSPVKYQLFPQNSLMIGVWFKTDGTKMYMVGNSGADEVYEYNLSTAWNAATASYVQSFSVTTQSTTPAVVYFKSDGTSFYIGSRVPASIFRYNLSTPWDISTASYANSFAITETAITGLDFKTDGTKMYIVGTSLDSVEEYNLSTAYDITTASLLQSFSVATQTTNPQALNFKTDGTKMYVSGILEYALSTAWNVSTASYTGTGPTWVAVTAAYFKPDGTSMYYQPGISFGKPILELAMSPAWDITTATSASLPTTNFVRLPVFGSTLGLVFKPDGTKCFTVTLISGSNDVVTEYSLSTPWDITTISFVASVNISGQEINPYGLLIKPDGTKLYIIGASGDEVNEYSLSTAWDISTLSFTHLFKTTPALNPDAINFNLDGTKMFIGAGAGNIHVYTLSTGWDVSTASYSTVISFSAQTSSVGDIIFEPDNGEKMFLAGSTGEILEYALSTAFDPSTASYIQGFTVNPTYLLGTGGIAFKTDGAAFYCCTSRGPIDSIFAFST